LTVVAKTDEAAELSLARDEVLADHLPDVPLKCDGKLVLLDDFDLAIAEHGMMHSVADRECRGGNSRPRRLGIVARLPFVGFRFDHEARLGLRPARYQSRATVASLMLSLVYGSPPAASRPEGPTSSRPAPYEGSKNLRCL